MATVKLAMAALAMSAVAESASAAISVRDDAGQAITLREPAQRIVSLAPHATELIFAAGAGERLVGVLAGSSHPDAARSIPIVGDAHAIDLERIVVLKPDLVVTWPYTTPAQVEKLKQRGISVFVSDPPTIDGIATNIERLGMLSGSEAAAGESASRFRAEIAKARHESTRPRVRAFYQIWARPVFTVGGGHLITQALDHCGADNVFASLRIAAPQVSVEAVVAARPDTIIAGADRAQKPSWLDDWKRWTTLPAVRDQLLQTVDADKLHRPGPRFASGVADLCAVVEKARREVPKNNTNAAKY
ncbi:MAG TPA: cobalamin-binding protein [Casimicrobiaceae bacterium]|nr:cobalamin-binding protein [Casimicrobiaceae bacterium]